MCNISVSPPTSLIFASFTFGFVHQLQRAEKYFWLERYLIFWAIKIFHSGLDGTTILYICLMSQTEIWRTF
jgi:hypothetical protein